MSYSNIFLTIAVAIVGMLVFTKLKVPAGAMLGSMLFVAVFSVLTGWGEIFPWFKYAVQVLAGVTVGSRINRKTLSRLRNLWKVFLVLMLLLAVETAVLGIIHFKLTDYDIITCFFSIAPGGITDLTILSADYGAVSAIVGLLHTFRQILIFIIIPVMAVRMATPEEKILNEKSGIKPNYIDIAIAVCSAVVLNLVLRSIGISLPVIIVSILASSLITVFYKEYKTPSYTSKIVQTGVGIYTGSMITRSVITSMGQLWVGMILVSVFMFLCITVNSRILEKLFGISRLTSMYVCAPGGLSEITLLAEETGGDIPTIAAIQTFRLLTIVVVISALAPFMQRLGEIL